MLKSGLNAWHVNLQLWLLENVASAGDSLQKGNVFKQSGMFIVFCDFPPPAFRFQPLRRKNFGCFFISFSARLHTQICILIRTIRFHLFGARDFRELLVEFEFRRVFCLTMYVDF
jgi:hypothetical protein